MMVVHNVVIHNMYNLFVCTIRPFFLSLNPPEMNPVYAVLGQTRLTVSLEKSEATVAANRDQVRGTDP